MAKIYEITTEQFATMAKQQPLQLIDIREPNEYATENIDGAVNMPLTQFDLGKLNELAKGSTLVFHCLSGMRTINNAPKFAEISSDEVYILSGGLNAWRTAGLATKK